MQVITLLTLLPWVALCAPQQAQPEPAKVSLDAKFKALGKKYFGVCADKGTLSKQQNVDIIQQQFGQLTPENSMKWDFTEKAEGNFSFGSSDYLMEWAANNSKIVRGHTLLWHSQLPAWVGKIEDATKLRAVLENHIAELVGRYKGRIAHWDVANEVLDESGNFRKSAWHRPDKGILLEDMLKVAFEAAQKADPEAKLYINDYNLDAADAAKTKAMVAKVKKWRAAGLPIQGVGTQAHLKPGQSKKFKAALEALCSAAPECAVTELDIEGAKPSEYAEVVKACLDVTNCVGVTVWGISDADSWRKGAKPLMFDEAFKEKEAFQAVITALS